MKNKLLIAIAMISMAAILFMTLISNVSLAAAAVAACNPDIKLVNQDPNPAVPGEYVKVLFEVSGLGNTECNGFAVKLMPEYPFSLDPNYNNTIQSLEGSTYLDYSTKTTWMISYKLRIADDALDGDYPLKVRYHIGSSEDFETLPYAEKSFDIAIEDSRTNFDAVIQETSGSDVSIAIANTGKYTANSVVVRIPEQAYFKVKGTDGQMVGNLISGDYTIVGFSISPKATGFPNISKGSMPNNFQNISKGTPDNLKEPTKLKVDLYYTDSLGERRIVNMELPLNLALNLSSNGYSALKKSTGNNSLLSKWYAWVILIVIILVLFGFYNKFRGRIKSKFFGLHKKYASDKTPDWVRNAKEKEKNK
jgi:hypothetical protein